MLFRKTKDSNERTSKIYQWPDADRKYQSIRFAVQKYRYSVSGSFGKWNLDLEGTTNTEPLVGLPISASLELLSPFETPRRLQHQWTKFPETIEGTCQFQDLESSLHPPQFNATLYCEKTALESILRTVALAGNPSAAVVVDLEFDFPSAIDAEFWRDTWRTKELRVRNWRIICESK